jgi:hypothetical protein
MSLVQKLKIGNLDIVGDVHGEYEALLNLLLVLGYDSEGNHPEGRKLVFVGDLCDRGPDSPKVILLVKKLVDNDNAQVVLGNHELNILQNKPKPGTGWYFESRAKQDHHYMPFESVKEEEKEVIYNFLASLPIALERDDLRVVHAAWMPEAINEVRKIPLGTVIDNYFERETAINNYISTSGLLAAYRAEEIKWKVQLEDPKAVLPFLDTTSQYNMAHQMMNPLRVLTSGVEQKCEHSFYAGGKWRFVERCTWWNKYEDDIPVVIGHFWRKMQDEVMENSTENNVFEGVAPLEWHGAKGNVYCVDYSVGGRFIERNQGIELGSNTVLAALRWPENELVLENGQILQTLPKPNLESSNNKFKV